MACRDFLPLDHCSVEFVWNAVPLVSTMCDIGVVLVGSSRALYSLRVVRAGSDCPSLFFCGGLYLGKESLASYSFQTLCRSLTFCLSFSDLSSNNIHW